MTIKKYVFVLSLLIIPALSSAAPANEPTVCPMNYAPVCALKQVQCIKAPCYPVYQTYGNQCAMDAAKATFVHNGECTGKEPAPNSTSITTVTKPVITTTSTTTVITTTPSNPQSVVTSQPSVQVIVATTTDTSGMNFLQRFWNWLKSLFDRDGENQAD